MGPYFPCRKILIFYAFSTLAYELEYKYKFKWEIGIFDSCDGLGNPSTWHMSLMSTSFTSPIKGQHDECLGSISLMPFPSQFRFEENCLHCVYIPGYNIAMTAQLLYHVQTYVVIHSVRIWMREKWNYIIFVLRWITVGTMGPCPCWPCLLGQAVMVCSHNNTRLAAHTWQD